MDTILKIAPKLMIRGKLIAIISLLVGAGIIGSTLALSWIVKSEIHTQAFDKIEAIRDNKQGQIEGYFKQINDQIITFSSNKMIISASKSFSKSFSELPNDIGTDSTQIQAYKNNVSEFLKNQFGERFETQTGQPVNADKLIPKNTAALIAQNLYIATNKHPLGEKNSLYKASDTSSYSKAHAEFHPTINKYLTTFGYYDIFLVDPISGNIVYSVFKEVDFATSLLDGPYSNTNLARAFKAAKSKNSGDSVVLVDFESYMPSYNSPASFIASPIYDGDELVSVLVFQMPVDNINSIMQQSAGLGETGETYLLGDDLKMRTQSRFSETNTILSQEVDLKSIGLFSDDTTGTHTIATNYQGEQSLITSIPLAIKGFNWRLVTEINQSEALAFLDDLYLLIVQILIVALAISLVFAVIFARSISQPLSHAVEIAKNISNNNLDNNIGINTGDETGQLLYSLQDMQNNLKERIDTDRQKLIETGRIKQALDTVSGSVLITDNNNTIIYLNSAAQNTMNNAQEDIRKDLPVFKADELMGANIGLFNAGSVDAQALTQLTNLTKSETHDLELGGRHLRIIASPVTGENNERIGSVVEMKDRTQEIAVEDEIQEMVEASLAGNLNQRIDIEDKDAFFKKLSKGVNELVDISERAINDTVYVLGAVSQGDLTKSIDTAYKGSFGELKCYTNATIVKLVEVMSKIAASSSSIKNGSQEITEGNLNLAQRTEGQASSLQETAAAMEEMTSTVQQNAANTDNANKLAMSAREQSGKGNSIVKEAVVAMSEITNSSNRIAEIIGVIDEIAFQTNLLALNAAVEAARAGEQGRGFAVVATEVRNLAGRSAEAAKEIKELIDDSVQKVGEGSKLVDQSGQVLDDISESVASVADLITAITAASNEQSEGIGQVNIAIGQMDEMTQQNTTLVQEAAISTQMMDEQASGLYDLVSFFTMEDDSDKSPGSSTERRSNNRPWNEQDKSELEKPDEEVENEIPSRTGTDDNWQEF